MSQGFLSPHDELALFLKEKKSELLSLLPKEDTRLEEWVKEAGEIPDATCPEIDEVITHIDKAQRLLTNITSKSNSYHKTDCECGCDDYADDADWNLRGLEDAMEKLRKSNEQLREIGKFWYEKCKEIIK